MCEVPAFLLSPVIRRFDDIILLGFGEIVTSTFHCFLNIIRNKLIMTVFSFFFLLGTRSWSPSGSGNRSKCLYPCKTGVYDLFLKVYIFTDIKGVELLNILTSTFHSHYWKYMLNTVIFFSIIYHEAWGSVCMYRVDHQHFIYCFIMFNY